MSNHAAFKITYDILPSQLISKVEIISPENPQTHGSYKGLWDTGATASLVTPKIVEELQLKPVDYVLVQGVNSLANVPVVIFNLILPNGIKMIGMRATVSELKDIDMLIGMDVIQRGDFSISNLDKKTLFSFAMPPFPNRTDLYEKAIAVSKRKK